MTCFLEESSEEQSVYSWVTSHCQQFPMIYDIKNPKYYPFSLEKSCIPFSEHSWLMDHSIFA